MSFPVDWLVYFQYNFVKDAKGCWTWNAGRLTEDGYGMKRYCGKYILTHRLSWMLFYGSIPESLCVLHDCDVRSCIRPDHLFLGTQAENVSDMNLKGRYVQARGNLKILDSQLESIRQECASGLTQKEGDECEHLHQRMVC